LRSIIYADGSPGSKIEKRSSHLLEVSRRRSDRARDWNMGFAMKCIRMVFNVVMGLTMIPVLLFIAGVLWLIEAEDKKNPSGW
jgi:hypothetical protein